MKTQIQARHSGNDRLDDRLDRGLVLSVAFHGFLAAAVMTMPALFPAFGDVSWGSETGGGGGISVEIVSNLGGVPLPAPPIVSETAVANESAGLYETAPEPPPEPAPEAPPPAAEPVPEVAAPIERTPPPPAEPAPRRPPAPEPPPPAQPDNAVPFGQGGRPAISYGQFSVGDGTGGVELGGDGVFGERYGAYVNALTRRISQNWLQSMVDAQVRSAPRIYVSFDILRDGTITNPRVEQGSGNRSLDNSALRAIYASNPVEALPTDFRGRSVSVRFWFEYRR